MTKLQGLGTALITPFLPDGQIDTLALKRLVVHQIQAHVDFLVVLGTTGEAATMDSNELAIVRQTIYEVFSSQQVDQSSLPQLVLGVGGNCTARVLEQLKALHNELVNHYAAILSVCPYYNKPSQEGLFQHFCTIATASPIPVLLYNVPGRTGVNLLPDTVIRLYQACPEKIIGIKEASGNLSQIQDLISKTNALFELQPTIGKKLIFSGDDGLAAPVMKLGGAGLISVASNAWPEDFLRLVHEVNEGLQAKYQDTIQLLFREGNPVGIKAALSHNGLIHDMVRLPLVPASDSLKNDLFANLQSLCS